MRRLLSAVYTLTLCLTAWGCEGEVNLQLKQGGGDAQPPVQVAPQIEKTNPDLFATAQRYFPSEEAADAPARLFRLTRRQLVATTTSLLPGSLASVGDHAMPKDPLQTNYEYAANLSFNPSNFTPYANWVEQRVKHVRANPKSVIDCAAAGNSQGCLDAAARKFVARAFRGAVSEEQLSSFSTFFLGRVAAVGVSDATADLVDVVLASPGYLFRDEVRTDTSRALPPAHLLQNLTYTLADEPPEALALSSSNAAEAVGSREALDRTVASLVETPQARQKLMRFFTAWLEVKEADEFTIAPTAFPEFTSQVAAAAVEETRAYLAQHLSTKAPRLSDVTQSTRSVFSQALAFVYGLAPQSTSQTTSVEHDRTQRLGIFTLPAVIASHSGPASTRLVKRGVFFTRKVMCLPLGAVPSDIDTTLPEQSGLTERQRIEGVTNQPRCAGCHAYINPFGFIQENYDPIGRWRELDEGLPIDPSISINFLDEGELTTRSPVEAFSTLTRSMRFKQCFVRQLFRFYVGRDELPSDDPLLRKMFFTFAQDDSQDLVGLLRVLATSPQLSRREEAP